MHGVDETVGALEGLAGSLLGVTEAAAVAAAAWVGRGQGEQADAAAVAAMRRAFAGLPLQATVVIGEGEKDAAPMLYNGERLGRGGPELELAVDPVEGTALVAAGMPGGVSVLAAAPPGSLMRPGPSFYMDKLVVPPAAADAVDPAAPLSEQLAQLGAALDRPVADLRVFVLDKPRHQQLVAGIRAAGARACLAPAGDVLGGLMAALGERVDALMGVGGTPEGIITACMARALGAGMWASLAPQSEDEARRLAEVDLGGGWMGREALAGRGEVLAVVTGITGCALVGGVEAGAGGALELDSLVIGGGARLRRVRSRLAGTA